MITRPTTLIIGAGASAPYGYPLGIELRDRIAGHPVGLRNCLRELGHAEQMVQRFCEELDTSRVPSIDAFLERRPRMAEMGKAAIAWSIGTTETEKQALFRGDWLEYLWREMLTGVRRIEDLANNKLSVVTFNYDSTFERFMVNAIRATFDVVLDTAMTAFHSIPVVHVYGRCPPVLSGSALAFGGNSSQAVATAVKNIIVMHEGQEDSEQFDRARALLRDAEIIGVLGFGYLAENVARLRPVDWMQGKEVHSTFFKMSDAEVRRASQMLPSDKQFHKYGPTVGCHEMLSQIVDRW